MSLYTNEYTVLMDKQNNKEIVIKPNIEFEPFEGTTEYVVSAYARVLDSNTREQVVILNSGETIKGIGTVVKKSTTKKTKEV